MKIIFNLAFSVLMLLITNYLISQTVLIDPAGDGGFENGADFTANGWTVSNSINNPWFVGVPGGTTNPGAPMAGNKAFVSSDSGVNRVYSTSLNSQNYFWRDVTVPDGETVIQLSFNWDQRGEDGYDIVQVFYAPTSVTPVGSTNYPGFGTTFVPSAIAGATYIAHTSYIVGVQSITVLLPPSLAGTTFRLIFLWKSDSSVGLMPPAAIDNISLTSAAPVPLVGGNTYPINNVNNPPIEFSNISNAVAHIALNGVIGSGQVIFELGEDYNSATEPAPINIPAITGTGATLGVTFRPATGVTAMTSIAGAASPNQHAIQITGSYITLDGRAGGTGSGRDWTIRNTGTTNSIAAVRINNPAPITGTNVRNLILEASATGITAAILQIGTSNFSDNIISNVVVENNLIRSQSITSLRGYGITTASAPNSPSNFGLVIRNNEITRFATRGINLTAGFPGQEIYGNQIYFSEAHGGSAEFSGIFFSSLNAPGTKIYKNFIYNIELSSGSSTAINGIWLLNGNTTGDRIEVYNNVVVLGDKLTGSVANLPVWGLRLQSGTSALFNIYYNSIAVTGMVGSGSINSSAFYKQTGNSINLFNNIFFNNRSGGTGIHWAINVNNITFTGIGNNDYWSTGVLGTTTGAAAGNRTTLDAWKAAIPADAASVSQNPNFLNLTGDPPNLRIDPDIATPLESGASGVVTVTTDFDGTPRFPDTDYPEKPGFPAFASDIGAFEFGGEHQDLVPPVISYSALLNTSSTEDRELVVSVTDYSGVPVAAPGWPHLYWRANSGAWNTVSPTSVYGSDYIFNFGGGVALGDTVQYYVVAQDSAENVAALPAGGALGFDIDPPSVSTPPTVPRSYSIVGTLSGTYSVGIGQDYNTLTAAVADLNSKEVIAPVVFELWDNAYSGDNFPIVINKPLRINANDQVTIRPKSGVSTIISGSSTTGILFLNGADYIVIDGSNQAGTDRSLTIENINGVSGSYVIGFFNNGVVGASNSSIKNTIIKAGSKINNTLGITLGSFGGGYRDINIQNNEILNAGIGLQFAGSSDNNAKNSLITQNVFGSDDDVLSLGLIGVLTLNADSLTISNNIVKNIKSFGINPTGIFISTATRNSNIYSNSVSGIIYSGTGNYGGKGLDINTGLSNSNILISNNIIFNIGGGGSGILSDDASRGLAVRGTTGGINIFYNSINLFGTYYRASLTGSSAIFLSSESSNIALRNNVFSNAIVNGLNENSKAYAIYNAGAGSLFNQIDNNDYYATGSQGILGFQTSEISDLASWRTATGGDANSISADPLFNTNTELQPLPGSPLVGAGSPIAGIATDFLGVERNISTPTIGSYEQDSDITPPSISHLALNAACDLSSRTLSATITDFSGVPTMGEGLPVLYWRILGGSWMSATGSHAGGDIYDFTFGSGVSPGDTVEYYIVARDNAPIPNVAAFPPQGAGGFSLDPPAASMPPVTPSSYIISFISGSYTVGSGGDFNTLTEAVHAYNTSCLTGEVVFNLTDEVYNSESGESFPINIMQNPYASVTNTLTIKPASDSMVEIIGNVPNIYGSSLIYIKGSDIYINGSNNNEGNNRNLKINYIGPSSPGNNPGDAVMIGATGTIPIVRSGILNTIISNEVGWAAVGVRSDFGDAIYFNNVTIKNNDIRRSYYGIFCNAIDESGNGSGLLISENIMNSEGQNSIKNTGIYLKGVDGATVTKNIVANFELNQNQVGIIFDSGTRNSVISRNLVHSLGQNASDSGGAKGIIIRSELSDANIQVDNNVLYNLSGSGSYAPWNTYDNIYGIVLYGVQTGIGIYNNSIHLYGNTLNQPYAISAGIGLLDGSVSDIRNNVIVNNLGLLAGNGYGSLGIYAQSSNALFANINYNNYFVNPSGSGIKAIGQIGTSAATDLASWRTATGGDANSISADPLFNTNTELQPLPGSPLVGAGSPIAGITTDFLGVERNMSTPTIGSYEQDSDITPPSISHLALNAACDLSSRTLSATITDFSGVPTMGEGLPVLYWRILGGSWMPATGSHAGGDIYDFTFGSGVSPGDTVEYYIVARDNAPIPNVAAFPSQGAGGFSSDPPAASMPPVTPSSYIISFLSGSYTVGSGGDFNTLTEAVHAYNTSCLTGEVVFNLTDEVYNSDSGESFPINIIQNPYASSTNTLTIKPASDSAVEIIGSASGSSLINISGSYVSINGSNNIADSTRNLTIQNTGTLSVVRIVSIGTIPILASGILNCILINGVNTSDAVSVSGYFNDITIRNNDIRKARYGIFCNATLAEGNGGGLVIEKNIMNATGINALSRGGIYVQGVDGATISNNKIENLGSETNHGIWVASGTSNSVISGNTVKNIVSNNTGILTGINITTNNTNSNIIVTHNIVNQLSSPSNVEVIGIRLAFNCENINISNNIVSNIKNTGSSAGSSGIKLAPVSTGTNINVYNNFIFDIACNEFSWGSGIEISSGSGYKINHNTVHMNTSLSNNNVAALRVINSDITTGAIDLRNNIFAISQTTSQQKYAIYCEAPNTVFSNIDYNLYWSNGPNLGFIGGNRAALADIITGFGSNSNSVDIKPEFISATDLHIDRSKNPFLQALGTPIAGIITDIDNGPRSGTNPDIGADEWDQLSEDSGIVNGWPKMPFPRKNQEIVAVLKNFGVNTLENVNIFYSINDSIAQPYAYTGALAPFSSDTIVIGTHSFTLNQSANLKIWTNMPNGLPDQFNGNDSLLISNLIPALSDTVYVGVGAGYDLSSLPEVINAAKTGGILDTTIVMIQDGTYSLSWLIDQHPNFSCTKPLIFESESGDSTSVVINNLNTGNNTLILTGAVGMHFKRLSFATTSNATSQGRVIVLSNNCQCISFESCVIQGWTANSTSNNFSNIFFNSGSVNGFTLKNSLILNGAYGFHSNSNCINLGIINNHFKNQYYAGGYFLNSNNNSFINNLIETSNPITSNFYRGLWASGVTGSLKVEKNDFNLPGVRAHAIELGSSSQIGSAIVANNFIQVGINSGTSSSYGIFFTGVPGLKILHNTIKHVGHTGTASACIGSSEGSTSNIYEIKNNILFHQKGGPVIRTTATNNQNPNINSDFNLLYSPGSILVSRGSTSYNNLAAWQATGKDINSISEFISFKDSLDLHVSSAFLNGTATPHPLVTVDIDDDPRDTVNPDIGADEFDLVNKDVAILAISYPDKLFPLGTNPVFIKFSNNGIDTLSTMLVDWEVNGEAQPTYFWSGILSSGATYDSLDIGTYSFDYDLTYDIKVWLSSPNGFQDELSRNDTLHKFNLIAALSGDFTVGGEEPDFENLEVAITALNTVGAVGNVRFLLRPGTYVGNHEIQNFRGASCERTIRIQPESGVLGSVTISNVGLNNHTISFNACKGIILDRLVLQSFNTSFRHALHILNNASCNQVINCELLGLPTSSTSTSHSVVLLNNSQNLNNEFYDNIIMGGSYGLYLGTTSGTFNTKIHRNHIQNFYLNGVYGYRHHGISIKNNFIESAASVASSVYGIRLEYLTGYFELTTNDINNKNSNNGLFINYCVGTSGNKSLITNNFIKSGGNSTSAGNGLMISNSSNIRLLHNNISSRPTATSHKNQIISCSNIESYNNIFANYTSGVPLRYSGSITSIVSNYNVYYTPNNIILENGSESYTQLSDWYNISGLDENSLKTNPQYVSESDLHVTATLLNDAGLFISDISNDFDGDMRNNPPDIGADEFEILPTDDAGILALKSPIAPFASGEQMVKVLLKNYGGNTLESAKIRWVVNGMEQNEFEWTGSLAPAQCDTVLIGIFSFQPISLHQLLIWTEMPNGVPDSTTSNDALFVDNVYPALSGIYTIGGVSPDFNTISQATTVLGIGGIIGDVNFMLRNGTYQKNIVLNNFPRANNEHKVTFRSQSGDKNNVEWSNNLTNDYLIRLNNSRNVRFENITFRINSGGIFNIAQGSQSIHIENCRLQGIISNSSSSRDARALIYSSSSIENNTRIIGNELINGSYGIYLSGSSGLNESGTEIRDNVLSGPMHQAVNISRQDGLVYENNRTLNNTNSNTINHNFSHCSGSMLLNRNRFNGQYNPVTLSNCIFETDNQGFFTNNFIGNGISNISGNGLNLSSSDRVQVDFNTIHMMTNESGSALNISSGSNHKIRNNIISNFGQGRAVTMSSHIVTSIFDYNNFFTAGSIFGQSNNVNRINFIDFRDASNTNLSSFNADPLFQGQDSPDISNPLMNNSGILLTFPDTDYYGTTRSPQFADMGAVEFTPPIKDAGILELVSPATGCGLSDELPVVVRVFNYGTADINEIIVEFSLDGQQWISETITNLNIASGQHYEHEFSETVDFSQLESYELWTRTLLSEDEKQDNDGYYNGQIENLPQMASGVGNMIPTSGTGELESTVSFSWSPAPDAEQYDLYVWLQSASKPATPAKANLSSISTSVSNLIFGGQYNWQVTAKNICGEIDGPIHSFSVRNLPDLFVDEIIVPVSGFSGQNITIEWNIVNNGLGSTQNKLWTDAVYLSVDATFNQSLDFYLGGKGNLTALNPGESYSQSGTFTLPNGIDGDFYIFVRTDMFNNIKESNENNNIILAGSTVEINLIPPPDLRVIEVGVPSLSFSGQSINISYTVRNFGAGNTLSNKWKDRVYILNAPGNPNTLFSTLKTITRNGALEPDSSYTILTEVTIPNNIEGSYLIRVHTDVLNEVYEFVFDDNNTDDSEPINILRTPPPDLIINSLHFPDSVSINQSFPITWKTVNQGASDVINLWRDALYFSTSPTFNSSFMNTIVTKSSGPLLEPGDTIVTTRNVKINGNFVGEYFMYAFTDDLNQVPEYEFESNNIFKSNKKIKIVVPDLFIANSSFPDSILEGSQFNFNYHIKNIGTGNLVNRSFKQWIYLSDDDQYNPNTDILLATQNLSNRTILSGDSMAVNSKLNVPYLQTGNKRIIVVSDFDNQILESNEQNNVYVSSSLNIYQAPYPDLITQNIVVPNEVFAGGFMNLNYTISNIGSALAQFGGRDSIFISSDADWNRANATFLGSFNNTFQAPPGSNFQRQRNLLIPYGQNSNIYFVYIKCDAQNQIYEGTIGETNNISRSNSFILSDYPNVDLAVIGVVLESQDLISGMNYNLQYQISNLGDTATYFGVWQDRVYLSTDSIFSPGNDLLVGTINYNKGKINALGTKNQNTSVRIPDGIMGEFYLFVQTDFADINNDIDTENNYNRMRGVVNNGRVQITLPLYPNLRTLDAIIPVSITTGSSIPVTWITENAGDDVAVNRKDNLYLSTTPGISSGSWLLSSRNRGTLAPNQSATDSFNIVIPTQYSGNYFLVFSVDHLGKVYEHDKENDNLTILAVELVTPDPADLIVEDIVVPSAVIAGESGVFSWTTRNVGSNPAIGLLRDIAYISPDPSWEVSDEVLHIVDRQIYLPPQQSITTEVTTKVNGVADGDYQLIVRTDARNNIHETNENNNFSASADQMNVSIKEIFIDVEEEDTLINNENLYFKIFIDPEYEGRNMLFTLKSEVESAFNEVYIKFGEAPTAANADFVFQKAFTADQKVKVSNLQPGYYYIMLKGLNPSETTQEIEVLAEILLMEILDISPSKGGNKGFVTVFIKGSELDSVQYVNLVLDDSTQYYSILAHSFVIKSEELIVARFDLLDKLAGSYHVECETAEGSMAYRANGFEIIEGIGPRLHVQHDINPKAMSAGSAPLVQIVISYINLGDADIENQIINLSSANLSNPVYMSLGDYYNNVISYQLDIPAEDRNGIEGILRPGSIRTEFLYGIPVGLPGFQIKY